MTGDNAKRWIGVLVFVILLLNIETLELAVFIQALGFDVFVLLLELQLLAVGGLVLRYAVRPFFAFFLGFSMHPFIAPDWRCLRHDPASLGFAFPPGAVMMLALFCTVVAFAAANVSDVWI